MQLDMALLPRFSNGLVLCAVRRQITSEEIEEMIESPDTSLFVDNVRIYFNTLDHLQ